MFYFFPIFADKSGIVEKVYLVFFPIFDDKSGIIFEHILSILPQFVMED